MNIPYISDFNIVAGMRRKEEEAGTQPYYPTDVEVLAGVKVYMFLVDVGNLLRLQELTAWAINNYSAFNGIARARNL